MATRASSVTSPVALLALCALLLSQPTPSSPSPSPPPSSPPSPDYWDILGAANHIVKLTQPGADNAALSLQLTELREEWPALFSGALFGQEVWGSVETLAQSREGWTAGPNVSALCQQHTDLVLAALIERNSTALTMLDAMGKPSPDLLGINFHWPGAMKECLSVSFPNATHPYSAPLFRGEYCTAFIPLAAASPANPLGTLVTTGLCVPDSCSSMDITVLMIEAFMTLKIPLPAYPYATCQSRDPPPLDSLAIGALVVVGVIALLIVLGTALDVFHTLWPRWKTMRLESLVNIHHDDDDRLLDNHHRHSPFNSQHDQVLLLGAPPPARVCSPGLAGKMLMAFSVYTNGAKLLSTEQASGTLGCVHGIRFLSMTWVVLGHTFLFPVFSGANIIGYFSEVLKRWTFQAILNASVSVDTFFVLSGLLVAYLSLKEMKKNNGNVNWFLFYFHRFWRLTPCYMLVILVYCALWKYWGSGPLWISHNTDGDNCKHSWWTNLLYINNFVYTDKTCLGQSWYLANDMQFYILSPLIFVPFFFSPVYGVVSSLVFLVATTVPPAAITMSENLQSSIVPGAGGNAGNNSDSNSYMSDYYIKPYNRMAPYIAGMVTGYLLYHTNCRARINKVVNLVCWAVSAAVALAVLYGLYESQSTTDHPLTKSEQAAYNSLARTGWGMAVCWVIFACVTGNGGYVNTILSWKGFIPLSRLTYSIYLIHIAVLELYILTRDTLFYYSDANVVMLFLGILVICYMLSMVVSLAFEAPMMALEKLVLPPRKKEQ